MLVTFLLYAPQAVHTATGLFSLSVIDTNPYLHITCSVRRD